jgi:serine phosphatase RsbU (regulator of sigma subunit)
MGTLLGMDEPGGDASAPDGVLAATEALRLALRDSVARTGGPGGPRGAEPESARDQGRAAGPGAAEAGAWVWDIESGLLTLDDRLLALLGVDASDYDGHVGTWGSVVHPDDRARVSADTDRAISTFAPFDGEYRICRPDGATRWARVHGQPEPDAGGHPCRMIGTAWDSTRAHEPAPEDIRPPPGPLAGGPVSVAEDTAGSRQLRAGQAAAGRAARIQDLTAALAEAVTSRDVVAAVAEHVLPPFGASGLLVEVAQAGHLRVIGAVGYPRPYVEFVDGLALRDMPSVVAALDGHRPFFLSSVPEHAERFPELSGWLDRNGKQAWAFLPLVVSGQAVGLCIISFDWPCRLLGAERALLIALSGLIAQALERARLFDAEHAQAQELQRGLLPRRLPSLPGVTAAARYIPGAGATIGGDWYDVIPLSADRVALVIGDVMGHGLSEAVVMGRMRTAVQTLSDLELPPDEILAHLNDVVAGLGDDGFVTCLYAIYDPVAGTCTYARAGHPPPALVRPDGTVSLTQEAADPPLGVAEPPFETFELAVPDESLLALYTDGLIETPHSDLKAGLDRLAEILRTHRDQSPEQLCDTLTDALLPAGRPTGDDTALLVARVHATPSGAVADWSLPDDPLAASAARQHVRGQLAAWELDDMATSTEMLASELVANVVRHAQGPVRLRLLRSRTLVCEVFDGSVTTPRIRRTSWTDETGRGLQLVAALCDRWGTRQLASGKSIWTEQCLP